jgi:benzoyl-CoA reductase subunit C
MSTTDPAGALLEHAQSLVEDLQLGAVRAWKAAHPGGLAIGHLPVYVPRPLVEGLGGLPVALFGGGDQIDVVRGDAYFQSYICHIPRSTIELATRTNLDVLDGVIFPSTCDVIRNLGGMWQLLRPDHYVAYLDLPQNLGFETGGRFYAEDLRRIARGLEARGAGPLSDTAMRAAIEAENRRRGAIARLDALRREAPWLVRASEAYLVVRAGSVLDAAAHETLIEDFLSVAKQREARRYDNVRVVMVGAFCEQPPLALLRTLERSGCDIIEDDMQLGSRYVLGDIDCGPEEDPFEALARAFLDRGTPTASRYIGDAQKGRSLLDSVKTAQADGVIFAAASFCDPALLDQPMLEEALDREGVPHTSFKFAENTGQFQVIREQAGAFSDSVKLWGTAS